MLVHILFAYRKMRWARPLMFTLLACATTTVLALPLLDYLDLANIVMLFLLTVLLLAVKVGRQAAVLASVVSVLCFDVFFVPPRFSLAVNNIQYVVTFVVMLITALTTTHFTTQLRQQADQALRREQRTLALYQLAKSLTGVTQRGEITSLVSDFMAKQNLGHAWILNVNQDSSALIIPNLADGWKIEPHLAQMALQSKKIVNSQHVHGMGYASLYLPLLGAEKPCGVVVVDLGQEKKFISQELISLAEGVASLVTVALERLYYAEVAHTTQMHAQSERLRNSILSALSHDLRTPLTALVGLAESLSLYTPPLPSAALETAQTLHEQATRLAHLVGNLLDMAKLNTGTVTLRKEWQPLEEVIGSSLKLLGPALRNHQIQVHLENNLPLLAFDAVLIERVLCNLLENAAKYTPAHTVIEISAKKTASAVEISVTDEGDGFSEDEKQNLFKVLPRTSTTGYTTGSGWGLSICKAIVEAHQGHISTPHCTDHIGAVVQFTLPLGEPPNIEDEPA